MTTNADELLMRCPTRQRLATIRKENDVTKEIDWLSNDYIICTMRIVKNCPLGRRIK
jgi:hypothetical protein